MCAFPASLQADLKKLRDLQFRRYEHCHNLIRKFYRFRKPIDRHSHSEHIWNLYQWLLSPRTLWAIDYAGIAGLIAAAFEKREALTADTLLLLKLISSPPAVFTQGQISEYEKVVAKGLYESISKQPEKFRERMCVLNTDNELRNVWSQLSSRFGVAAEHGVIRRTLARERNFGAFEKFSWKTKNDRFRLLFDAMCYKWCLYGFENGKPLLLKISVNPTPHGTMIVIPRHMSLDGHRDLDWDGISQLHRAHGAKRQGRVLSAGRVEKEAQKERAKELDAIARKAGLKGEKRLQYILSNMNQDTRRISWIKRLLGT